MISVLILLGVHIWCTRSIRSLTHARNLVLPGDKTFKISVLSGKSIFCLDTKAIASHVDVQKVLSGISD